MVRTASTMVPLGTEAPAFALPDVTGNIVSRDHFSSARALLVAFLSSHCPSTRVIRHALAEMAREYAPRGLATVGINANDDTYAVDAPGRMADEVKDAGYSFPYLYDESQAVARAYGAACTPDFFLFDASRHLTYRGRFDDSRPSKPTTVTGRDLRAAIDAVLEGRSPPEEQVPSVGCNIKWRRGNEPEYFQPGFAYRVLRRLSGR
jgi:peroxiredoxin